MDFLENIAVVENGRERPMEMAEKYFEFKYYEEIIGYIIIGIIIAIPALWIGIAIIKEKLEDWFGGK